MIREGLALLAVAGLVTACATAPAGPSVLALPGTGKPFDQFQGDEAVCRQWASEEAGTTPQSAAGASVAQGAAIGTLGGAGVGAALGAVTGHAGVGAAVGAVGGLLTGSAIGAGAGHASSHEVQRRYDNAYLQCMYARGNQIPAAAAPPAGRALVVPPPPPPAPAP
jgi:hypothetical protein